MISTFHSPDTILRAKRVFNAPREKVFEAWTNPELIKRWMGGMHIARPLAQVDLRPGGDYRIRMQPPGGAPFLVVGTYIEVQIPEKLVYTWRFEGAEVTTGETLVKVEFRELGSSLTEVTLVQERFPSPAIRDLHREGWANCLDALNDLLGSPHDA